jgi:hypothetical protein
VLPTPTGLGITGDCSGITVSWNPVAGATSYQILRAPGGCGGAFSPYDTTTSTEYTDLLPTPGIVYGYAIQAVGACTSEPSGCVFMDRYCTGDVNCDCLVDIGDALLILQFTVGLRTCEDPVFCYGCQHWDVNCDGVGDFGDALLILQVESNLRECTDPIFCVNVCNPVCTLPGGTGDDFLPKAAPESTAFVTAGEIAEMPEPGSIFELPVYLSTEGRSLGGYVLDLAYDPAVLEVEEIAGGSAPEFSEKPLAGEAADGTGRVRFAAVNYKSLQTGGEKLHVATVKFKVLGPAGEAGAGIALHPVSFKDTDGRPIQPAGAVQAAPAGGIEVMRNREGASGSSQRGPARPGARGR